MNTIMINCIPAYPIHMGSGLLSSEELIVACKAKNYRSVLITDSNLSNTWAQKLNARLNIEMLIIPAGESFKTRETKQHLEDILLQKQYGRDTCMIALGGGVVCDIVGFLASTYCRGVPSVYIPTTLLAMADASIGGKTGVNTVFGKNMIGTFYQPKSVFMDMDTLCTLPETEWKNGLSEIIKHALIYDKNLFRKIKDNKLQIKKRDPIFMADLVFESCQIKKHVVEFDEKELSLRQILNFGHTVGHGIESFEQYQIGHGQAVGIGMAVESYLSLQSGLLKRSCFEEILQQLEESQVKNSI